MSAAEASVQPISFQSHQPRCRSSPKHRPTSPHKSHDDPTSRRQSSCQSSRPPCLHSHLFVRLLVGWRVLADHPPPSRPSPENALVQQPVTNPVPLAVPTAASAPQASEPIRLPPQGRLHQDWRHRHTNAHQRSKSWPTKSSSESVTIRASCTPRDSPSAAPAVSPIEAASHQISLRPSC